MRKKPHDFLLLSIALRTNLTHLVGTSDTILSKRAAFLLNEDIKMASLNLFVN